MADFLFALIELFRYLLRFRVMMRNMYSSAVCTQILPGQGRPSSTIPGVRKLETLGCPMVKTASLCVLTQYRSVTDGQTDGYAVVYTALAKLCGAL